MRSGSLIAGAFVVLTLSALPVSADTAEELARLRHEAAELRHSLERLEARIQALESQAADSVVRKGGSEPQPAPPPAVPDLLQPVVTLKQNWSQVERGVSQQKVQSLLGQPGKVLVIDGSTVWYYAYPGIGRASVFFSGDGKVSSVQSPSFGW